MSKLASLSKRWTVQRKAALIEAVHGGWLAIDEACGRYALSVDEFLAWERALGRHGVPRTAALEERLWEQPETATAALALVEFAGVVTADRFLGEVLRDQVMAEERDAFYQTVALANVAGWINKLAMRELWKRLHGEEGEVQP